MSSQDSIYLVTTIAQGKSYNGAKIQAECRAREELVGKIKSQIAGSVHSKMIEKNDGAGRIESQQEMASESQTFFEGELGKLNYLLEVAREVKKGEIEVVLVVGYKMRN